MSKALETLREMAKLTVLSNRLNDIQVKNLQSFPFVFFMDVNQVEISYDLTNSMDVTTEEDKEEVEIKYDIVAEGKAQHITYKLAIPDMTFNDQLPKRLKALEGSVRNIFWNDLKVHIYINDKLEFESGI